ncbi:MAG: four helix bundle protein [Planctomycetota bacterium]|nr:four helix bundle protein [Planctomycetota bacterium]
MQASFHLDSAEHCRRGGKQSGKDQARFYDNARGSALECAACLDVLVAMQLVLPHEIESGKEQVAEIVDMLTSLAKSVTGDRVNDETVSYSTSTST